jgi:hypothetical protein
MNYVVLVEELKKYRDTLVAAIHELELLDARLNEGSPSRRPRLLRRTRRARGKRVAE